MEAELTKNGEIHVTCDTGIFWEVLHKNAPWLEDFKAMGKSGVIFSFADHALAEIIKQLEEGRFTEAEYVEAITACKDFITPDIPLVPGKRQLGQWCQPEPNLAELENHLRYLRACWHLMTNSKTLKEFGYGVDYELQSGEKKKASLNPGQAAQRLEEERTKWRDRFANVPSDWKDKSLPDRLKFLAGDLDSEIDCTPSLTTRLDAALRHENRMVELKSLAKTPYNPLSENNENDGIDFNMSYVFMKRILLCTLDGKYRRPIQDLKSYQSSWIFSPQDLVAARKSGKLVRPGWPDAAPAASDN
jgi:hypothetical protein